MEERKDSSFWLKTLRIWFKQLEGLMEMKQVWNREKGRISAWDVLILYLPVGIIQPDEQAALVCFQVSPGSLVL